MCRRGVCAKKGDFMEQTDQLLLNWVFIIRIRHHLHPTDLHHLTVSQHRNGSSLGIFSWNYFKNFFFFLWLIDKGRIVNSSSPSIAGKSVSSTYTMQSCLGFRCKRAYRICDQTLGTHLSPSPTKSSAKTQGWICWCHAVCKLKALFFHNYCDYFSQRSSYSVLY